MRGDSVPRGRFSRVPERWRSSRWFLVSHRPAMAAVVGIAAAAHWGGYGWGYGAVAGVTATMAGPATGVRVSASMVVPCRYGYWGY